MIKHIVKQIWSQRGKNSWIILELFMVFIILWYVVDFFSVMGINAATTTGTEIQNIHRVILATNKADNPKFITYENESEEPGRNFLRIIDRLKSHPDIESVCIGRWFYPYCTSSSINGYFLDSLSTQCQILKVTPEYFNMFNVLPHNGKDQEILTNAIKQENAAILSLEANRRLFKNSDGTGKIIYERGDSSIVRITGVTHEMKKHEYARPESYIIGLFKESDILNKNEQQIWDQTSICIKTRSGISQADFPARFKEEMKQQLAIGNYFLADIRPLSKDRENYLWSYGITTTLNYRIGIGLFFLINLFLGVLGTFWLRIEKRKSEIGLRMSVGSTKARIMSLMLTESLCMLVIASVPALLVCFNLAYLDILSTEYMDITASRILINTLLTYILLSLVIALSVWYPAKRSATTQPAEALHYE